MSQNNPIYRTRLEFWKPVPDYPDYWVSTYGRVLSFRRKIPNYMSLNRDRYGYTYVGIRDVNGVRKMLKVHRLVLLTFIGVSNLEVNHIDGCKTNNHISNLEYCTSHDNRVHAVENGLTLRGKDHPKSKLNKHQVLEIRRMAKNRVLSHKKMATMYNVSKSAIHHIVARNSWEWLEDE